MAPGRRRVRHRVGGTEAPEFGQVNVLPASFLIDRWGRIRYEVRGIFAEAALAQSVDRLLAESGPAVGDR